MKSRVTPEFSFPVKVSAIDSQNDGAVFQHEANESERSALAMRFGLVALPAFRFSARLRPTRSHSGFRLAGRITAEVTQRCVVTLEPVTSHIDQPFDILLFDETDERSVPVEIEEDFETFDGDVIDLGELSSVELVLSLDPYPRVPGAVGDAAGPGASLDDTGQGEGERDSAGPTHRPFAGLAALRRNR